MVVCVILHKAWCNLYCLSITKVERLIDICYVHILFRNLDESIFIYAGVGIMLISSQPYT